MATYTDVSPIDVRTGDTVKDASGNTYTAWRDAAYVPETGMVNIVEDGTLKHHDYDTSDGLTVSYDESAWLEEPAYS